MSDQPLIGVEPVVVYELKVKDGGTIDVTLSHVHRSVLLVMAERGGQLDSYDFDKLKESPEKEAETVKRFGEPLVLHVKRLITMGLISAIKLVGSGDRYRIRLTDTGRNIVTQIKNSQKVSQKVV